MADMGVERKQRATLTRVALRGLVFAGVAGTAWLLWSGSAEAGADRTTTTGDGLTGLTGVTEGDDPLLGPALGATSAVTGSVLGQVVVPSAATQVVSPSAPTGRKPGGDEAGDPLTGAQPPASPHRNGRGTHIPRTADGSSGTLLSGLVAGVVRTGERALPLGAGLLPVDSGVASLGWLTRAVTTVTDPVTSVVPAAVGLVSAPQAGVRRHLGHHQPSGPTSGTAAVPAAAPAADGVSSSEVRRPAGSGRAKGPVGDRAGPATGAVVPLHPQPVRLPPYPGQNLAGTLPATSGSTADGALAAVQTNRSSVAPVLTHRRMAAADVAARPLTVVVPTVSPD